MPTDKEKQLIIAYQNCFATDAGKLVLDDLRKVFNFDVSVISTGDDGHIDIYDMMRCDGKRSVIIHILRKIAKDLNESEKPPEPVKQEDRNFI